MVVQHIMNFWHTEIGVVTVSNILQINHDIKYFPKKLTEEMIKIGIHHE